MVSCIMVYLVKLLSHLFLEITTCYSDIVVMASQSKDVADTWGSLAHVFFFISSHGTTTDHDIYDSEGGAPGIINVNEWKISKK